MDADPVVFKAIGDATRRTILDELIDKDGQTLFEICGRLTMKHGLTVSRQAISARGLSPQFRVVCMAVGVIPERIGEAKCLKVDAIFQSRFDARADSDRRSVDLIEARILMAEVLAEIMDEE